MTHGKKIFNADHSINPTISRVTVQATTWRTGVLAEATPETSPTAKPNIRA